MRFINSFSLLLFLVMILPACQSRPKASPEYITELAAWHQARLERLKTETGWLNLAGLYWLQEGENTIGVDEKNEIVFPAKAAPFLGTFYLKKGVVNFTPRKGVEITCEGKPAGKMTLLDDSQENTTILDYGDLRFYIIKRGDRYGIRLRDLKHKRIDEFKGIDRFPVDENWRIKAKFELYDPPKKVIVPDIIGGQTEEHCFGAYVFEKDGRTFRLETTGDPAKRKSMFVVFGDLTNKKTTYGGGRFIYIPVPDEQGTAVIDFNKAYNPPCVFSPYATCPLPMEANTLAIEVSAGEKMWGEMHH